MCIEKGQHFLTAMKTQRVHGKWGVFWWFVFAGVFYIKILRDRRKGFLQGNNCWPVKKCQREYCKDTAGLTNKMN